MRRPHSYQMLGLALAAVVALAIGTRLPLKAQQPTIAIAPAFVGGAFGGSNEPIDPTVPPVYLPAPPMTVAETKTRLKLHEKIPMTFANATPLEDVVKYIEQATIDKVDFPEGLSIYVDPNGLQDADKTMASPISLNLKNQPLESTLGLLLSQLSLTYRINKDGLVMITASSDDVLTPSSLDHIILSSLSSLRAEVQSLRAEIHSLRRGDTPEEPVARTQLPKAGTGPMGGGFR